MGLNKGYQDNYWHFLRHWSLLHQFITDFMLQGHDAPFQISRGQKKKCQQTDPPNIPILRLFRLCFMSYLHNLVLWQGFQYPKKRKMVNLRTEEQDHEYLENGKRYHNVRKQTPKTCTDVGMKWKKEPLNETNLKLFST